MFKLNGKYKTRDGRSEWLVVYLGLGSFLAVKEAGDSDSKWFFNDGSEFVALESDGDLMPRTKTVTRWTNIYEFKDGYQPSGFFESQAQANTHAHADRLACSPITFPVPDDDGSDAE